MRLARTPLALSVVVLLCLAGCGDSASPPPTRETFPYRVMGGSVQEGALSLSWDVTTLAGSAGVQGTQDCTLAGAGATFTFPKGIATDGKLIFVADTDAHTIRVVDPVTGGVTTLAGEPGVPGSNDGTGTAAHFNKPRGITTDGYHLYVTDGLNFTVRKVDKRTGAVSTLAGTLGAPGTADNTDGLHASFAGIEGITTDNVNLYLTDFSAGTIRKVAIATGAVSTLAGTANVGGWEDNVVGANAKFDMPFAITTDCTFLYVAEVGNHAIRKVAIDNTQVSTLAGSTMGWADGTGSVARFNWPRAITTDGAYLYVCDGSNQVIRKVTKDTGEVTTVAGQVGVAGSDDLNGTAATFSSPSGIIADHDGLLVSDGENATIRRIR